MKQTKREKLKEILRTMNGDKIDFSAFDAGVAELRKSLEEKVAVPTLEKVNSELGKFQEKMTFEPLLTAFEELKTTIVNRETAFQRGIEERVAELNQTLSDSRGLTKDRVAEISTEVKDLEDKLSNIKFPEPLPIPDFGKDIKDTETKLTALIDSVSKKDKSKELEKLIKDLEDKADKSRIELINRINERGGGNMNRQIKVNSVNVLTKYTDFNLIGAITTANNNTTKAVDITIADAAASIGGTITGGTAGSVLFVNPSGILAQDNTNFYFDDSTNQLELGDGTYLLPSYTWKSESTTGFFLHSRFSAAAGTFTAVAAGQQILNFTTSGLAISSGLIFRFPSSNFSTANVGLAYSGTAALLEVNNGATVGTLASLQMLTLGVGGAPATTTTATITQAVGTTGSPTALLVTGGAHTTLTASTEAIDINYNLARTVQFATGALTTQRAVVIQAPTYAFVGASTITTASTLEIGGFPIAGTNATITGSHALTFGVAPKATATSCLVNLGNANIAAGSANGTYIGVNPAAFTGDFFNFQVGGTMAAKMSYVSSVTTMTMTGAQFNNGNSYAWFSNNNADLNFMFGPGTTAVSSAILSGNRGILDIGAVWTYAPNGVNTNTQAGVYIHPIVNAGGSNSGGTFSALRVNPTLTSVTGLTNVYLAQFQAGSVDKLNINSSGVISTYNAIATAGWGVPAIYGTLAPATGQTARSAAVATYTCGAADGDFEVSGQVTVSAAATCSFSLDVTYTDAETNTARTLILPLAQLAGTFVATGLITNLTGVGPYESAVMHIRVKASTTITIRPSNGTFTSVTYGVSGIIKQLA